MGLFKFLPPKHHGFPLSWMMGPPGILSLWLEPSSSQPLQLGRKGSVSNVILISTQKCYCFPAPCPSRRKGWVGRCKEGARCPRGWAICARSLSRSVLANKQWAALGRHLLCLHLKPALPRGLRFWWSWDFQHVWVWTPEEGSISIAKYLHLGLALSPQS